ncbi:MAG: NAD(P)-dependent oxidoreductase [Planctomycetota bacterium]|nr:MAG: NAD(P)-dependent oxidoreductase [Planctomycetota bacterium]
MKIAVIGLGTMGAPMASHLVRAGHEVRVHNRTRSRERPLLELGAAAAATPAEAAAGAEVVLSCVSDTADAEQVLTDADTGALAGLAKGALVIDCSTISPEGARRMAAVFAERGVGFVDAPVSGGSEGALNASLAIMCGGSEQDFARALPVLNVIGGAITRVGPVGCGQIAKAVNQVVLAGVYQGVAEGMVLAHRAGADAERVMAAIEHGAASSWVLTNRGPNMRADHYPLGFRVRLHRKDLGIALDTARAHGIPLPVASYVATQEDGLIHAGHGDEDMSSIARTVRRNAGIPDGPLASWPAELGAPRLTRRG